ncbi:hypothetical protein M422DRAFT_246796 [Sphaerobolus stellatus SS14]|nr:hypothetical protein M422DRAFT_246796 [Sphaerobolus stellatus SS14]
MSSPGNGHRVLTCLPCRKPPLRPLINHSTLFLLLVSPTRSSATPSSPPYTTPTPNTSFVSYSDLRMRWIFDSDFNTLRTTLDVGVCASYALHCIVRSLTTTPSNLFIGLCTFLRAIVAFHFKQLGCVFLHPFFAIVPFLHPTQPKPSHLFVLIPVYISHHSSPSSTHVPSPLCAHTVKIVPVNNMTDQGAKSRRKLKRPLASSTYQPSSVLCRHRGIVFTSNITTWSSILVLHLLPATQLVAKKLKPQPKTFRPPSPLFRAASSYALRDSCIPNSLQRWERQGRIYGDERLGLTWRKGAVLCAGGGCLEGKNLPHCYQMDASNYASGVYEGGS